MSTKTISTYSGSVASGDWKPALDAAYTAMGANGGTFDLDADIELKSIKSFTSNDNTPIRFKSDGGYAVKINQTGVDDTHGRAFVCSGQSEITFDGITFVGETSSSTADCEHLMLLNSFNRARVLNCNFAGIASTSTIVYFYQTFGFVHWCAFGGSNATNGNIYADECKALVVEHSTFFDYQAHRAEYYDKVGSPFWIQAVNPPASSSAFAPFVHIRHCRFDEGSASHINIVNYPDVVIEHCRSNVAGAGSGYSVKGARKATISHCWIGYRDEANRKAIILEDVDYAVLENIELSNGVTKLEFKGSTRRVIIRNCYHFLDDVKTPISLDNIINTANASIQIERTLSDNNITQIG